MNLKQKFAKNLAMMTIFAESQGYGVEIKNVNANVASVKLESLHGVANPQAEKDIRLLWKNLTDTETDGEIFEIPAEV